MTFVKQASSARAVAWEAACLDWLRAGHGATVVDVVGLDDDSLILQRLSPVEPTRADAARFGVALARTHAAGAAGYGVGPPGWDGPGFQGPAGDLLPLPLRAYDSWGAMYADQRVRPLTVRAGLTDPAEPLLRRLRAGEFDDSCDGPARLHGDLWSGNVVWTVQGAVLIDPAAYAGHPESDLAALALFGAPHLATIRAAYLEAAPLADDWRSRVPLMQLHLVLLHAALFGGGYVGQARDILDSYR